MGIKKSYRSVTITRVFMKIAGIWYVETKREQRILLILFCYTLLAIIFAIIVEGIDLYHCKGDVTAITYNLCSTILLVLILLKIVSFLSQHSLILGLIKHAENNFWKVEYDKVSSKIMDNYDARGMILCYLYTCMVILGAGVYIIAPVFENMNRNETDRILPFKLYVDLPLTETPWYEVTYTIQSLSTIHSGLCTFCFDNFVCMLNLHSAAQMKILGSRMQAIVKKCPVANAKGLSNEEAIEAAFQELKKCVQDHYTLIDYLKKLNTGFSIIMMGELLLSSILVCAVGFQLLTIGNSVRRYIFIFELIGAFSQLLMYTWTCNEIIVQSLGVSDAAYNSNWEIMPQVGRGEAVKNGLLMILIRARRPCTITAANFATMSLETFTNILSSSISYFTILRQMNEE